MGRTWVPIVGAIAGLVFVLTQLTGSDVDREAQRIISTLLTLILFTALGSAGLLLSKLQPRLAPLGAATATLALLAFGATIVLTWGHTPSFFLLLFEGTAGTVAGITDLLALTGAMTCVLLATIRPGEDDGTRLTRLTAIGSLALFIALAILILVDNDIGIGARAYAIVATVFVAASVALLVLRLLPLEEDSSPLS